jgi:putative hemolysin
MITIGLLALGLLLALAASGFFSGTEMGIYSLNGVRLRVHAERGDGAARRLLPLMDRFESLVVTTLVGTNIADYLAAAFTTAALLHLSFADSRAELYATLIVTPALLVFGNIIPKERFRRDADRLMFACSLPLTVWTRIVSLTGLPWLLSRLSRVLIAWLDPRRTAAAAREVLPQARMLELLREGASRGGLSVFQQDTFARVMSLSDTPVARVMVPRPRAATIPVDLARDDLLRIARMAHFSRLPVWKADPTRVIGLVDVFDVLADNHARPVAEHVREVIRVRPDDSVLTALRKLQQAREVMAIVCDRRGRCMGLITIKDLVEEIVGDLPAW